MNEDQQKRIEDLQLLSEAPEVAIFDEIKKINETLTEIKDKPDMEMPEIPQFPQKIKVEIDGLQTITLKGDKGDKGNDGKNGKDGKDGRDGRDGNNGISPDIDTIIYESTKAVEERLKPFIPTVEDLSKELPKLGLSIRDGIELLPDGQKLSIQAIEDLAQILEDLKKQGKGIGAGVGGANPGMFTLHFIDDETPTGTIDGINTDFTINLPPSPVSSLKVYRGGARQRITQDYTFSGQTIRFTVPPEVGEILLVDYRT